MALYFAVQAWKQGKTPLVISLEMSETEVREVVGNGQSVSGLVLTPEGTARLVEAANGSPYLANLIAHEASSTAIDRNSGQVEVRDIVAGIVRSAQELTLRLDGPAKEQVAALLRSPEREALRVAMRHALDHFAQAPVEKFPVLARVAGGAGHENRWLADGKFVFHDDSVPLIAWLTLASEDEMVVLERAS